MAFKADEVFEMVNIIKDYIIDADKDYHHVVDIEVPSYLNTNAVLTALSDFEQGDWYVLHIALDTDGMGTDTYAFTLDTFEEDDDDEDDSDYTIDRDFEAWADE